MATQSAARRQSGWNLLSALTLDLFSVLLGGAEALLPVFADQILHVGPEGLGILRAAPAAGAVVAATIAAAAIAAGATSAAAAAAATRMAARS